MALYKEIKQPDGVTTYYHRISSVTVTTNRQNSIAVFSYVNGESRDGEKSGIVTQPYIRAITYETDYSPNMTIDLAYEYLKTRLEFDGATDV